MPYRTSYRPMKSMQVALLLALPLVLASCAGATFHRSTVEKDSRVATSSTRIAAIVASWEASGGSRLHRPVRWESGPFANAAVSAAWWGYDPTDATDALQAAIDYGAPVLVIPRMEGPWILSRTLTLRSGGIEILIEPGVVILAGEGAFRGGGDCLIEAVGAADFSIIGYGASLRMRKADYQKPPYEQAEWRHAISLRSVARARIAGLRIESSGGDGIYLGTLGPRGSRVACEDLVLQDLEILDNHRQGVSIISAKRLLIEDCRISGSTGALPMAGIDFEPNATDPGFEDCTVRGCWIEGNRGVGIQFALANLDADDAPVSIRVENCTVNNPPVAISVMGLAHGLRGSLTFLGNTVRGLQFLRGSSDFSVVSLRTP